MKNILITLAYNGSAYHGWQIQNNALTVQEVFQNALVNVINERPDIKGCSRTDSYVHANMYCVSFKTDHPITPERLMFALNRYLPMDIAVTDAKIVPDDFHARYSCIGKEYIYRVWNSGIRNPFYETTALHYRYPIDESMLDAAAKAFVGSHNFTSFCTLDKRQKGDFTRDVKYFNVERESDMVTFTVAADGFLYNMVRIMIGTLLAIQQGKIAPTAIPSIILAENRKLAGPTAPAHGLYLNKVFYDNIITPEEVTK